MDKSNAWVHGVQAACCLLNRKSLLYCNMLSQCYTRLYLSASSIFGVPLHTGGCGVARGLAGSGLEGCGFTGFQVFTGLRCSRFEKPVRSKKTEKPVFTGDITTNTTPPELEASSMAESQEKFVANQKGKAPIWEFFRFRCKDGQVDSTKAYCTECKASVKLGGGTSNMSAHVRRHHPLLLNKPFGKAKVTLVRNPPDGKNTLRI